MLCKSLYSGKIISSQWNWPWLCNSQSFISQNGLQEVSLINHGDSNDPTWSSPKAKLLNSSAYHYSWIIVSNQSISVFLLDLLHWPKLHYHDHLPLFLKYQELKQMKKLIQFSYSYNNLSITLHVKWIQSTNIT